MWWVKIKYKVLQNKNRRNMICLCSKTLKSLKSFHKFRIFNSEILLQTLQPEKLFVAGERFLQMKLCLLHITFIYSKIMCTNGQWNFVSKKLQMYKIGLYGSQYVNFVILPYVEYSYTVSKSTQLFNQQQGGSFCSKQLGKVLVSFVCCRAGSR